MICSRFDREDTYDYLCGFGNTLASEAISGALPEGQNAPQKNSYGLYTEKLSGSAFTAPRAQNKQTWLYRILPSASHSPYVRIEEKRFNFLARPQEFEQLPTQARWDPFDIDAQCDFVRGLRMIAGAGDPTLKNGIGIYIYAAGRSMRQEAFFNADGEMLIVPQEGDLDIQTEFGRLLVRPSEIAVIPRGVKYAVKLPDGKARGYILETFTNHFELPELGPIGSNGLANPRDFLHPTAAYNFDIDSQWKVMNKFDGKLYEARQSHTPFDVVAWHGNYIPYKYDLGKFNTIGTISYDHPDPSIFTVLTCPSNQSGTAIADFVVFPPRWLVAEHTFRPPWYHRNTMSEFMGLIKGSYDAKAEGFNPFGASLHNIMQAHGPDAETFEKASNMNLAPGKVGEGSLAFMFESMFMVGVTKFGRETSLQGKYVEQSWGGLNVNFNPAKLK